MKITAYRLVAVTALAGLSCSSPLFAGDTIGLSIQPLETASVEPDTRTRWIQFRDVRIVEDDTEGARYPGLDVDRLALHGMGCDHGIHSDIRQLLWDDGRFALVLLNEPLDPQKISPKLRPVPWGQVITRRFSGPRGGADPAIQSLLAEVDGDRWFADVTTLANWDRHTRSSELPLARDWLQQRLDGLPGISTTIQSFTLGADTAWNVIGRLDGQSRPDEWYIIGAHYDSRRANSVLTSPTPGAEDNASGCAGVLEVARIMSAKPPEATVFFACYSGEEQGLFGSARHAQSLVDAGTDGQVAFMLNMDMIGYSVDASLDALFEAEGAGTSLIDTLAQAATTYTSLNAVTSVLTCCSDHMPYLNRGIPAILSIEDDWNVYPHYHTQTDLPANMNADFGMGPEIIRTNLAVLAEAAGFDQGRVFSDGFE